MCIYVLFHWSSATLPQLVDVKCTVDSSITNFGMDELPATEAKCDLQLKVGVVLSSVLSAFCLPYFVNFKCDLTYNNCYSIILSSFEGFQIRNPSTDLGFWKLDSSENIY